MDMEIRDSDNEHLGQGVIKKILRQPSFPRPSGQLKLHLKTCDRCRSLFKIIQRAKEMQGDAELNSEIPHLSKFELTDLVVRAYDKSLSPREAAKFLYSLANSDKSFNDLVAVVEGVARPLPEEAETKIAQFADISIAEKALEMVPSESITTKKPVFDFSGMLEWISVPKLAVPAAATMLLLVASWNVVNYFGTDYKITKAEKILADNYRVFYKDTPRLSGNYDATAAGAIMGSHEQSIDKRARPDSGEPRQESTAMLRRDGKYLKDALRLTEDAIANGSSSPEAIRLQAQIYIIEGQFEKAEARLNSIASGKRNAAVFNDLGVLNFKQGDLQKAADYFESAIQFDPTFKEAYYNLALVQKKRGLEDEAEATTKDYLELETNEDWQRAAKALIK